MDKVIKLENVNLYNEMYGLETLHPLVSVVDLTKATKSVNHAYIGEFEFNAEFFGLLVEQFHQSKACAALRKARIVFYFICIGCKAAYQGLFNHQGL